MSTKIKHKANRTSVKLAVILTTGLIGGALIPNGTWAQGPAQKFDQKACDAIKGEKVIIFVVDQSSNPPVKTYFGGNPTSNAGWPAGVMKDLHLKDSVSIGVSVGNPTYCYTLGGSRFCVTY